MTVANPSNRNVINGDGSTTAFSFTFNLPAGSTGSDVQVYVIDNNGNVTLLASNYTVDVTNSLVNYPVAGGVAPLAAGVNALPVGWSIAIMRVEAITQGLNLVTLGAFSAASIMAALDSLTMICQQLQEQVNRCLQYPVGSTPSAQQLNPNNLTPSIPPLIVNGTLAQIQAKALAAPTVQFFFFATDLGPAGTFGVYTGSAAAGQNKDGLVYLGGA